MGSAHRESLDRESVREEIVVPALPPFVGVPALLDVCLLQQAINEMASQWTLMDVLEKVEAAAGVGIQISKTPLDRIKSLFRMWTDDEMPKSPMVALNKLAEMCGVQDRVGMVKQQAGLFLPSS